MQITLFSIAIACYVISFVFYSIEVSTSKHNVYSYTRKIFITGALFALAALLDRWIKNGHPPLSNMYESMVTISTFIALAGLFFTYRRPFPLFEGGTSVVAIVMIGLASIYSPESRPLIPALQSYWLHIHVSLAFLGESCFAIACIISYIFCFKQFLTQQYQNPKTKIEYYANLSIVVFLPLLVICSMILLALHLKTLPAYSTKWINLVYGVIVPICSAIIVLIVATLYNRESLGAKAEKIIPSLELLDSLTYRAIAIGYPLFSIGAIIFGMVWANQAWGRYWGWDPKETWALITFLVYSLYLHVRLTRGWKGTWMAVISVAGFIVTLFTLFGVNFLVKSLHSYS